MKCRYFVCQVVLRILHEVTAEPENFNMKTPREFLKRNVRYVVQIFVNLRISCASPLLVSTIQQFECSMQRKSTRIFLAGELNPYELCYVKTMQENWMRYFCLSALRRGWQIWKFVLAQVRFLCLLSPRCLASFYSSMASYRSNFQKVPDKIVAKSCEAGPMPQQLLILLLR